MNTFFSAKKYIGIECKTNDTNTGMTYMHYHNVYEIYYLIKGKRKYLAKSKIFDLSENCITLTPPDTLHSTSGKEYQRIVLYFSPKYLTKFFTKEYIEELLFCFTKDFISGKIVKKNGRILNLLRLIEKENTPLSKRSVAILAELLTELSDCAKQESSETKPINYTSLISNVLAYIDSNLDKIKGLEDVASHHYVSKYYLSHLFKSELQITLTDYLIKTRITRAMILLKETKKSAQEISEMCGFQTNSYFCLTFKKITGKTPLEFRKQPN